MNVSEDKPDETDAIEEAVHGRGISGPLAAGRLPCSGTASNKAVSKSSSRAASESPAWPGNVPAFEIAFMISALMIESKTPTTPTT